MINLNPLEWVFTVKRPAFLKGGFRFTPFFFEYCSCSGVLCVFFYRKPYSCSFRFGDPHQFGDEQQLREACSECSSLLQEITCDPNEVLSPRKSHNIETGRRTMGSDIGGFWLVPTWPMLGICGSLFLMPQLRASLSYLKSCLNIAMEKKIWFLRDRNQFISNHAAFH